MPEIFKIKYCLNVSIALLLFCLAQSGFAQEVKETKPDRVNLKYLYDPEAPVQCESRVAVNNKEATVFLRVTINSPRYEGVVIRYQSTPAYNNQQILNQGELNEREHLIKKENSNYYYRFTLPVSTPTCYLFVNISKDESNFRFDIPILTEQDFPPSDLLLMRENEDIPLFQNFVKEGETFRVNSLYPTDSTEMFVYYYSHNFAPNLPPMATEAQSNEKELKIDSIFSISPQETLSFSQQGLYFAQTDTTSLSGLSFRVANDYYPKFGKAPQLLEPLIYISTSEEMEELMESEDKKKALDTYWLKVTRSQERAREVIREYYRQVTLANALFTNYKEGWKTGQGMVYLLYGLPDEIFRTEDRETWIYSEERNLIEIQFVFAKVKNIFTDKHYELIPNTEYRKFWYRNIDLWRKGRKEI